MDATARDIQFDDDHLTRVYKGQTLQWTLPQFPLDTGTQRWKFVKIAERLQDSIMVLQAEYQDEHSDVALIIEIKQKTQLPFFRMRYRLRGTARFAGLDGKQKICYGAVRCLISAITEVQLAQFDRILHSFIPSWERYQADQCIGQSLIGPLVFAESPTHCVLVGYEHGAQAPDHFLHFHVRENGLALLSSKGNYYNFQSVADYRAPWIQIGMEASPQNMREAYRLFMLEDFARPSRTPYIFYNTWHFQEGRKYFQNASVLRDMNEHFLLADIDRAHDLGVEVYVIDTGWYQKTGDWEVNESFFPNEMLRVRQRLAHYGMKLGLWFNPTVAAATSDLYLQHPDCVMMQNGQEDFRGKIWETEESFGMCLASDYSDLFIQKLVHLYEHLGVRYFKWDAIDQYGCDAANHNHGTTHNSPAERKNAFAYRMGLEMIRIAEEVGARCPDAIIDFDITEGKRFVGLGFLSVGKYFLINNGPYFHNLDIPEATHITPDTINAFFHPGPARAQICRQSAAFDNLIPSVLFLTHFLPHGSPCSQRNNMAAMVLGGNGIWGFLEQLNAEDVERWQTFINNYKQVREDFTKAYPIRRGSQGNSPEIHEKINPETGRGCVVFFTHAQGIFEHTTQPLRRQPQTITPCMRAQELSHGAVRIRVALETDEATVVFFI